MKDLWQFFRQEKKWYILIVLMLVLVDGAQVIIPILTKRAVDAISAQADISLVVKYGSYVLAVAVFIIIMRYTYNYILRKLVLKLDYNLKTSLFNKYLTLPKSYFEREEIGDLMARVTNDTKAIRFFLIMGFLGGLDVLLLGVTTFIMMFIMNPMLAIIVSIPLVLLIPLALNFGRKIHIHFKNVQRIFGEMTVRVREVISGIRVIKAFTREGFYLKLFKNVNEEYIRENMKLVKLDGFFDPIIDFLIHISLFILMLWGGSFIIKGRISMGTLVAFTQYIGILTWPMMAVGFSISLFQRARASMERIQNVLQTIPEVRDIKPIHIEHIERNVNIKNLSFSYPDDDRFVLKNISLSIHEGELIGITGATGGGKSTLLSLLLRVYNPPPDTIFFGETDILKIPLQALRKNVGYVPQAPFLFGDTLLENIKIGKQDATIEDVEEAAKIASIYEDIMKLPNRFDTVVGEKGITLSGGERQRVAVARAILTKRPLMLFDDPLSAVDTDTEKTIIRNLKTYLETNHITTLLVSQRVSALTVMDRVVVLSHGKILEEGAPDKLFDEKGYYFHLYRKQLLEGMEV